MLYNKEKLIRSLDEWAFAIEQEYKNNGEITPKKKRQHFKLIGLRDEIYDKYIEEIKYYNSLGGTRRFPSQKYCYERMTYNVNRYRNRNKGVV